MEVIGIGRAGGIYRSRERAKAKKREANSKTNIVAGETMEKTRAKVEAVMRETSERTFTSAKAKDKA